MNVHGAVLVVEDDARTRAWLVSCVREAFPHVDVSETVDVRSALAAIDRGRFSIAVVDLGLPDGSGIDVIRALQEARRPHRAYIVVATLDHDDGSLFRALEAGARGYLLKDEDRDRVVAQLRGIPLGDPPVSASVVTRLVEHFNDSGEARRSSPLSPREEEVLRCIAAGASSAEIAARLGLTANTIKSYTKTLYSKLGVGSRAEAVLCAVRLGLVDPQAH